MLVIKKWLRGQGTSLFFGVIVNAMVFSFKNPKEDSVKLFIHQKPIGLLTAIESLKTDAEKLFHYFEHKESDLPGNLHVGGKLCFNVYSPELVDLTVTYYFGEGKNTFHEFTVTIRLADLDIIVDTVNNFFVEK